jgi:hypothetical protein
MISNIEIIENFILIRIFKTTTFRWLVFVKQTKIRALIKITGKTIDKYLK